MKDKLTKLEKYWILYDVGNSAFVLLVATIIPIYFNALASGAGISEVDYLAYWGYAASITTIIVACIGPILGTMTDMKGYKKPIFTFFMMMGVLGLAALSFPTSWILFLVVFVIAKVGFNASLIFYDAMLNDITTPERMDNVSSQGYIGSCIPFVISLIVVLSHESLHISMGLAMTFAFLINALWWFFLTLPLLKTYQQKYYVQKREHMIKSSLTSLIQTAKSLKKQPHILYFLLAFFFYIDGVYTVIDMASAFGTALGFGSTTLLLALLVTQIVAFPCSLLFGYLAKKAENSLLIRICIIAYTGIALFALQLDKVWEFWFLAILVGMFQGGIQALSRSYFAKIIPPEKTGEYFGIYDICGKGASFLGTTLVGITAQLTDSVNMGVAVLAIMFIIGLILFNQSLKQPRN